MSADRNEALRLADALVKAYPHIYTGLAPSAAALLCQQAERIAELEARVHTCGPTCSKAGCINRRLTTERDQLRAEVERLSVEVTAARENGFRDGYEQRHAEVLGALA